MTYTEAVEFLETHGMKVSLGAGNFDLIKQCAEEIAKIEGTPELPLIGRFNTKDLKEGDVLVFRDHNRSLSENEFNHLLKKLREASGNPKSPLAIVLEDEIDFEIQEVKVVLNRLFSAMSREAQKDFIETAESHWKVQQWLREEGGEAF